MDPVEKFNEIVNTSLGTVIDFIQDVQTQRSQFVESLCYTNVSGSVINRVGVFNNLTIELTTIVDGNQVYLGKEFCDDATLTYDFIKLFRPFLGYFDGIFEYFGLYVAPECAGTTVADAATVSSTGVPVVEACAGISSIIKTAAGTLRAIFVGIISPSLDLFMTTEDTIVKPLCSCRVYPGSFSSGSGCDKQDNNCDRIIDDCEEDHTKPSISLDPLLVPSIPFSSEQDALQFLTKHLKVSDDCAKNLTKNISLTEIDGIEASFHVEATDQRCAEKTENATHAKVIPLKVDAMPPNVSCGFSLPQYPFPSVGGKKSKSGSKKNKLGNPSSDGLLVVDRKNFKGPLADIGFWYTLEDNSQSKLQVQVEVLTNERVSDFSDIATLYLEQTSTGDYGPIRTAGVILELRTCSDPPSKNNGVKNPLCMAETGIKNRFYDVVVSARDTAGHRASATCSVAVLSYNDVNVNTESSRRFLAANLDFEYDLANTDAGESPIAPAEIGDETWGHSSVSETHLAHLRATP